MLQISPLAAVAMHGSGFQWPDNQLQFCELGALCTALSSHFIAFHNG